MLKDAMFENMMEKLYYFSKLSAQYQNIPRTYGNSVVLYMAEAHMIQTIGSYDGTTVTELSKIKEISKSAVSQIVKKLFQKNLIVKDMNGNNKKTIILRLSEEGKKVYEFHNKLDEKNYTRYMSKLGDFSEQDILKCVKLFDVLIEEFIMELKK